MNPTDNELIDRVNENIKKSLKYIEKVKTVIKNKEMNKDWWLHIHDVIDLSSVLNIKIKISNNYEVEDLNKNTKLTMYTSYNKCKAISQHIMNDVMRDEFFFSSKQIPAIEEFLKVHKINNYEIIDLRKCDVIDRISENAIDKIKRVDGLGILCMGCVYTGCIHRAGLVDVNDRSITVRYLDKKTFQKILIKTGQDKREFYAHIMSENYS